jgi:hypothetical protein
MDDPNSAGQYFLVLPLSRSRSLWSSGVRVVTRIPAIGATQNREKMIVYALVSVEKNVLAEFAVEIGTSWSKQQLEFLIQSFAFPMHRFVSRFSLW